MPSTANIRCLSLLGLALALAACQQAPEPATVSAPPPVAETPAPEATVESPSDPAAESFAWTLPAEGPVVDARMNIYLAGQSSNPVDANAGVIPLAIALNEVEAIRFDRIEGRLGCAGVEQQGPDGGDCVSASSDINALNGFSGIRSQNRSMFLVGLFALNPDPANPPPHFEAPLEDSALELSPIVNQLFLIGDGRTQDGQAQSFKVPEGAGMLYLGFADAAGFYGDPGFYDDNVGSLRLRWTEIKGESVGDAE